MFVRRLADLLLGPTALGPTSATRPALLSAAREAAGRRGLVEELTHAGDAREPAELHALFASPGDPGRRATLLFLHGKGGCSAEWRPDAARALRLGYNVLVPDLRGHPPSTGPRVTYGHFEREDIALLVEAATERFGLDPTRLGVDGCSMGSLIALQVAAGNPSVRALWLQSPFGDLSEMAVRYVQRATMLPRFVIQLPAQLAVMGIERTSGLALTALDPVEAAALVNCPAVVVRGEDDPLVPFSIARKVYEALGGKKEYWHVPRCGHCHHPNEPQAIYTREYEARWTAFFEASLPVRRGPEAPKARRRRPQKR